MRLPEIYKTSDIVNWDCSVLIEGEKWIPARPESFEGLCLIRRIKLAWGVFTGKNDVLKWEGGQ